MRETPRSYFRLSADGTGEPNITEQDETNRLKLLHIELAHAPK